MSKKVTQIRDAIKDMMSKVDFHEELILPSGAKKKHLYVRKEDGAWLQGVSSVSEIVPKPWLAAWGGKEAVKFLGYSDYEEDTENAEKMYRKILGLNIDEYVKLLKEAKGAAFRKSKEALVDGKKGHDWLEEYVLAKIRGNELPRVPKKGNLERPIKQFLDWEKENIKEWVASEAIVAYPEKGYAGKLDAIAILKDNRLALVDFKFASKVSPDYYLQLAGYAATFEPYGIKFDTRIILRLPKTLEMDEWDPKTRKYNKVENTLEEHRVGTGYEEDRDVFFNCLPMKKWVNKVGT